ncbi:MAG: ABC transporter ATP-binding protein [Acidimicrobiia bacterium]|nr:ABC transporter ATP-binding protein [Acidimicrobiia bacterium]
MIRAESLTKAYGRSVVVDDVSFEIGSGESVAFWGPNGAGKTTIVRCLLGLVHFEGQLLVDDRDVARRGKEVRRLIGHVPQELAFYEDLSVDETLTLSAELRTVDRARIASVLETVDLTAEVGKKVGALSGGMKQRLGLAAALLADPPILVLDEPTSNLDIAGREKIMTVLEGLRADDRTLILTSHHLEEVGSLADRALTMAEGRILAECAPAELADRLGISSRLHIVLSEEDRTDEAVALLRGMDLDARRNSRGVIVDVSAQNKGAAIGALLEKGIGVADFEVWR